MSNKPHVPYPNDAVAARFDGINDEIAYRERINNEIAVPIAKALEDARRGRLAAVKELGLPEGVTGQIFFVKGKGVFWEDENWVFSQETQGLVPRDPPPATDEASSDAD